jgi:Tfp pilus assembly protein PilN
VKAVNLIPAEQRRGAGGIAGRSGGIVYVVVGALAVVVALGVVYAFAVKTVADRTGQLAAVTGEVGAVQAQKDALEPYVSVHQLRQSAVGGVVGVAETRFDWPDAMRQLVLALPDDVTLTSLTGTASAQAAAPGSTTTASPPGSTFSLAGCASSQAEVATVLTRLSAVQSVSDVSLESASKSSAKAPNASKPLGPNGDDAASGACPLVSFNLTFDYAEDYTVPNQKIPTQTVSRTDTKSAASLTAATKKSAR